MHPSLLVLQDALDDRLMRQERRAVDDHLAACGPCRRQMHALRWTKVRMAGAAARVALPPGLHDDVKRVLGGDAEAPPTAAGPPGPAAAGWRRWFGGRGGH